MRANIGKAALPALEMMESRWWPSIAIDGRSTNSNHSQHCHDDKFLIECHRMWVQLSTTCSNFTKVAQYGAPSCSQPQPAMDNGVKDGRSNWLVTPYTGQYPWSSTYCTLQCGLGCKSQDLLHWVSRERATFGMPDQRTACAATQGINKEQRTMKFVIKILIHLHLLTNLSYRSNNAKINESINYAWNMFIIENDFWQRE